jgi:hypothetical protein
MRCLQSLRPNRSEKWYLRSRQHLQRAASTKAFDLAKKSKIASIEAIGRKPGQAFQI